MNFEQIGRRGQPPHSPRPHTHAGARPLSRRQLMRTSAAVAAGLVAAPALLGRGRASAAASTGPLPLPGGTNSLGLGGELHFYGPTPDGSFDPVDATPITIADFTGVFGLAYISGMCTRTNMETKKVERFPFNGADMRFMKGAYIGEDGKVHNGAFAFI